MNLLRKKNQGVFNQKKTSHKIRSVDGIRAKAFSKTSQNSAILIKKPWLVFKKYLIYSLVAVLVVGFVSSVVFSVSPKDTYDLVKLFQSGKYLVLFQNNAELRATGGFIGSYGVVDVNYGRVKNYYIEGNIYERDDKYQYMMQRKAPEPLQTFIVDKFWSMHDANWWVDYPQSAQEVSRFYELEGGEKVDGVIAINATFIANLLNIIGPVYLEKYGKTFTADNFIDVLQFYIEKEYPTTLEKQTINQPKGILKDIAAVVWERVQQKQYRSKLLSFIKKGLGQKDILLHFNNSDLENLVLGQNWGGEVKKTLGDYLYINNSNLGGLKSSLNIKQTVSLHSSIGQNKKVVGNLKIIRTHTGNGQWPDGENKNYMRILVPNGSQLLEAKLDEVDIIGDLTESSEAGKTVFSMWFTTGAGQTKVLEVNYQLPFKLKNAQDYSLYLQKQPGVLNEKAEVVVNNQVLFNGEFNSDQEIR